LVYDKTVIARALAAYDLTGNLKEAMDASGVSCRRTIHAWIANREALGFPASLAEVTLKDMYDDAKTSLLSHMINVQRLALARIEAKIGDIDAHKAAIVFGIMTDKISLYIGRDDTHNDASDTPRADRLTDDEAEKIIGLAAGILQRRKTEAQTKAIDVSYAVEDTAVGAVGDGA
jgi:hypothetical protein